MKEIFLCKYGEIALKGANRASFEALLCRELKYRLSGIGSFDIIRAQSTIRIEPREDYDAAVLDAAYRVASMTFGIIAICRCGVAEKNFDDIKAKAVEYLADALGAARTFKVETKRADKTFPMDSGEVSAQLGAAILLGGVISALYHVLNGLITPGVQMPISAGWSSARFARGRRTSAQVRKRRRAVCPSAQMARVCFCFRAESTPPSRDI